MKHNETPSNTLVVEDFLMDLGDLDLDEIVGQEEAIKELKLFVESIEYNHIYNIWNSKSPIGILLTGEPGTGKTASVRALAKRLADQVTLMELRYLDIASKWVDMPIEQLRGFFALAEEKAQDKHVIIFIDEIDAMIPSRDSQLHEASMKRVNVFLEWMNGGFSNLENITIIGATNFLQGVDKAALRAGRFDKIINFVPLSATEKLRGLQIHLSKRHLKSELLKDIEWTQILPVIENASIVGADLPEIINRLVRQKITAHIDILKSKTEYDRRTATEQIKLASLPDYMPEPIETDDVVKTISEYVIYKQTVGPENRAYKNMGFALTTSNE